MATEMLMATEYRYIGIHQGFGHDDAAPASLLIEVGNSARAASIPLTNEDLYHIIDRCLTALHNQERARRMQAEAERVFP